MDDAKLKERRLRVKLLHKDRQLALIAKREEMLAPYRAAAPAPEIFDRVQYKHEPMWGRTYAVLAPLSLSLTSAADSLFTSPNENTSTHVQLQYGVSKLNPYDKDQYCRETGRVVAASKITTVNALVKSVWVDSRQTVYTLEHDKIEFNFMLTHGKLWPFLRNLTDSKCRMFYAEQVNAIHGGKRKIY